MRRILVTGANKGIGLAISKGILKQDSDTSVILGSRSPECGQEALAQRRIQASDDLTKKQP